jgi:hypothetical protein
MSNTLDLLLSGNIVNSQAALFDSNQTKISVFGSDRLTGKPSGPISVQRAVNRIQSLNSKQLPTWKVVEEPYSPVLVTWSGRFETDRSNENLSEHSGLICIVIKGLTNERLSTLREALRQDIYTNILFKTSKGNGLNMVVKINCKGIGDHETYYYKVQDYLQNTYSILPYELDDSCKVINMLCALSYDADAYFNPVSERLHFEKSKEANSRENLTVETASSLISDNKQEINTPEIASRVQNPEQLLETLLNHERQIRQIASKEIVFSPALIHREGVDIVRRGTINVIQGKYGQHKSRLAETFAALLFAEVSQAGDFLGFKKSIDEPFSVCYIDTERSLKEELPYAIQDIYRKAGYSSVLDNVTGAFRFTSIKSVSRKDRLTAVESFVNEARQSTRNHLIVFLDVVTDCIESYNDDRQAMKLFDIVGTLCENYDATFFLVIHENPNSEKARGHAGTEAANKASAVFQIGTENSGGGNGNPLIKIRYLKLRGSAKPEPIYLQYCNATNGLVVVPTDFLPQHSALVPSKKISQVEIEYRLVRILSDGPVLKGTVYEQLTNQSGFSDRTIRAKIKRLIQDKSPLIRADGKTVFLTDLTDGRDKYLIINSDN